MSNKNNKNNKNNRNIEKTKIISRIQPSNKNACDNFDFAGFDIIVHDQKQNNEIDVSQFVQPNESYKQDPSTTGLLIGSNTRSANVYDVYNPPLMKERKGKRIRKQKKEKQSSEQNIKTELDLRGFVFADNKINEQKKDVSKNKYNQAKNIFANGKTDKETTVSKTETVSKGDDNG